MSEKEALAALAAIRKKGRGDQEMAHCEADDVLIDFLSDNGFADIAESWTKTAEVVGFWYA